MKNFPPPPTPFKAPPPPGSNNNNNTAALANNRLPPPPNTTGGKNMMMNNNNNSNINNTSSASSSLPSPNPTAPLGFQQQQRPPVGNKFPVPVPSPSSTNVNNNMMAAARPSPATNNNTTTINNNNNNAPAPVPPLFNNNSNNTKKMLPAPGQFPAPTGNNNNTNGNVVNNNRSLPPPPPSVGGSNSTTTMMKSTTPVGGFKQQQQPPIPTPQQQQQQQSKPAFPQPSLGGGTKFPPPPVGGNNNNNKSSFPPPPVGNNNINNNKGFPSPLVGGKFPPPNPMNNNNNNANVNKNFQPPPPPGVGNMNNNNNSLPSSNPSSRGGSMPNNNNNNNNFVPPPPPGGNSMNNNNNSSSSNIYPGNNNNQNNNFVPPPANQQQQQQQQMQQQRPPQQQAPPSQQPPQEPALSHTIILEKSSAKNTRLMRHTSIPRASNFANQQQGGGGSNNTVLNPRTLRSIEPAAMNTASRPYHWRYNVRHARPVELEAVQCTTNVMPGSPQMAEKFGIPVGISVRPLAPIYRNDCPPEEQEQQGTSNINNRNSRFKVPLVHFQEIDQSIQMVRCSQCRSYINPFVSFTSPDRYICSVCRRSNSVPIAYQSEIDRQTGARTDIQERHELRYACCDIVAPQEYVQGAPKRPTMLFLIDVSYQAVTSGFLAKVCEGILEGIVERKLLTDDYQISFIAYDSNVYLFNLSAELDSPKMIAAPDLVFDQLTFNERGEIASTLELPCLLEELFCQPVESAELIRQLMTKLPTMFGQTNAAESAYGPALNTAMSILAGPGGKVFSYVGSCPGAGEGKLDATTTTKRGAPVNSTESPPANTLPANDFYKVRAVACSSHQISVDLIVSGSTEVDLATIAPISRYTSGHITRIHSSSDLNALPENIAATLGKEYGFDAVLRIRAPSNVTLKNFYGHFHVKGPDLLSLPVCDSDCNYSFELAPTNNINYSPVFVQVALMFTTRTRERRIRVMTFGMDTSSDLAKLYNHCSAPLCASFYAKMLVDQCITTSFQKAIQSIVDSLGKSLKTFRTVIHGMSRTPNQLSLPYSLQGLPLLLAGVFRSAAVRPLSFGGNNPGSPAAMASQELRSNDERVAVGSMLVFSVIDYFLSCVMPTCWCVWDPSTAVVNPSNRNEMAVDDLTGDPVLPRAETCSVESLRGDSMFVIDCGEKLFLWIGKNVPAEVLLSFGIHNASPVVTHQNNNNNQQQQLMFPEAVACAYGCNELIKNRQSLVVSDGLTPSPRTWGNIVVLFQDAQSRLLVNNNTTHFNIPDADTSIAFNNLGLSNSGVERSMYPFLVEDEMQDAVSYGTLLMSLAKKAGEP